MTKTTKIKKTKAVTISFDVMPQTRVWTSKDGRQTRMCDMSDLHIMHTLYLLKRNAVKMHLSFIDTINAGKRWVRPVVSMHNEPLSVHGETVFPGYNLRDVSLMSRMVCSYEPRHTANQQPTLAEASEKVDIATGSGWIDHVDAEFYALLFEAKRRDTMHVYIDELMTTAKMRMAQ